MLNPLYIEEFRNRMKQSGLLCHDPILADGVLHRFKPDTDSEANGWYILHADMPICGVFGCWKRQIQGRWHLRAVLQPEEHTQLLQRIQEAREQREEQAEKRFAKAQAEMEAILAEATTDQGRVQAQDYLQGKCVQAFGELYRYRENLLIPLRTMSGELRCIQRIRPDGAKFFWEGGKPAGAFFAIPGPEDRGVLICEGYATGASIHAATGFETLCAMNCGNLDNVAEIARLRWPDRRILICADDDRWGRDPSANPGRQAAQEAAESVKGFWMIPTFDPHPSRPTDFNDLLILQGIAEVRHQILGFMKKVLAGQNPNAIPKKKRAPLVFPELAEFEPEERGELGQPCSPPATGGASVSDSDEDPF